ncbi:MAG: GyrI-like domain-containing protein [Tepidisphaeraceae bacterium]
MWKKLAIVSAVLTGMMTTVSIVPAQPATQPVGQAEPSPLGALHVAQYPANRFVYIESQTRLAELGQTIGTLMPQLVDASDRGQIKADGPILFVYVGMQDMSAPFTLQVGRIVPAETPAPAGFKVRDLEGGKCATALFTGSYMRMPQAWGEFMQHAMGEAGLQPAGDMREMYLYHESPESENNVTMLMMPVK